MVRAVIAVAVALSSLFSIAGYTLSFGDDRCRHEPEVRLVPISGGRLAVSYAGVHLSRLKADSSDGKRFVSSGKSACSATLTNGFAEVRCGNFLDTGPAVMMFKDGRLVSFGRPSSGRDKSDDLKLLTTSPFKKPSVTQLWRPRKDADDVAWKYWNQSGRLRLWYFNPNAAGTLFAELSLALFALCFLFRKKTFRIAAGLGGAVFAGLLLYTHSRGSLLAFLVGFAVLAVPSVIRRFSLKGVLGAVGVVAVVAILLAAGVFGERFGSEMFAVDEGNIQRLRCWAAAPRMMADAPGGWGENCGRAYCDWYQAVDDTHSLRWLVNSHLTWMVEYGSVFGYCYVFAWMAAAFLLWRCRRSRYASAAAAQWALLFVSLWFSTVGIFVSLWVLPVLLSIPVLIACGPGVVKGSSPVRSVSILFVIALVSISLVEAMRFAGRRMSDGAKISVSRRGGLTVLGDGPDELTILQDGYVLSNWRNGVFGREIRSFLENNAGVRISVADGVADLPPFSRRLVLVGRSGVDFLRHYVANRDGSTVRFEKLFFISPPFAPQAIPRRLLREAEVSAGYGEYAVALLPQSEDFPPWVTVVPGAELYVTNWLNMVSYQKKE